MREDQSRVSLVCSIYIWVSCSFTGYFIVQPKVTSLINYFPIILFKKFASWVTNSWPIQNETTIYLFILYYALGTYIKLPHNSVISHTSKVMLKILKARLQQYVNRELLDVQAGFRKGRGTGDQIANIHWIIKKAREFQKNIYSCFIDYTKSLSMWITANCGKFWKRWEYQTTWPASWEICMQVKKQQLEPDMEQQTGCKSGKEYVKAVYGHPAYLTYMQDISCEMPGWVKHKVESKLPGELSITSDMQITPSLWQEVKKN